MKLSELSSELSEKINTECRNIESFDIPGKIRQYIVI